MSARKKKQKIVIYTSNFGNYESIKIPEKTNHKCRYILYSDLEIEKLPVWEVRSVDCFMKSSRRASRLPKILPHRYLPPHDISLYIDSSLRLKVRNIEKLVRLCLGDSDIALYPHYQRNCVYKEISFVREDPIRGSCKIEEYEKALNLYRKVGLPINAGLFENGFILRRNTAKIRELNEVWWEKYQDISERDQFTFTYAWWSVGLKPRAIPIGEQIRDNPFVDWIPHQYGDKVTIQKNIQGSDLLGIPLQVSRPENNSRKLKKRLQNHVESLLKIISF